MRKDLGWFGEFGKQGVGYEIAYLAGELRRILNLDKEIPVALVGVGSLGSALVRYARQRYEEEASFNLRIVALFDSSPNKIGGNVDGIPVWAMEDLEEQVAEKGIKIAIVTVPSSSAQVVADQLVAAGVEAILNFAPVQLTVPEGVHVANADVSLELHDQLVTHPASLISPLQVMHDRRRRFDPEYVHPGCRQIRSVEPT